MRTGDVWIKLKKFMDTPARNAFFAAAILALLAHLPIMMSDIPNHDGLASVYFDQNMVTSGRWFLTVACGISSYFTLPWLIGLLGIFYLSLAAVVLVKFLELKRTSTVVLVSGLLVTFPAMASVFAYVFTLDGYMLGLLLAVLAPFCVKAYKNGFVLGGVCLAFSLGIYQAYLPFAMLLSLYGVVTRLLEERSVREKVSGILKYIYMGGIGVGLYYLLLQVLLFIQGKELASYQGISGMGTVEKTGLIESLKMIYSDFGAFTFRGNVLFQNPFSLISLVVLVLLAAVALLGLVRCRKLWKSPWFYVASVVILALAPLCTSVILIISPDVTYHLLMRHQWVLYLILAAAFVEKYWTREGKALWSAQWLLLFALSTLVLCYTVTDQIAYSNLEKKYEKTYALCVRLADRMEQTPGYEKDMPVAMIGVVGDEQYPETDVTGHVTSNMIGMGGDYLLYTRTNYQAFFKHYLGITMELVSDEEMLKIYDSPKYREMGSFPAADSVQVVDGVLYVKLENREVD
ncbi:MAG: hypothetical protein E7293_00330 [Lachnospiraceae bacterium]|nr:hypothetical protein [Lachnospiraceae bacterium]